MFLTFPFHFLAMVPTFSILGEGSTIESLESITNPDVAKVVLPGENRPIDALKTVNRYQRKGMHPISPNLYLKAICSKGWFIFVARRNGKFYEK